MELLPPQLLADHRHRECPGFVAVFFGQKGTATHRPDAQDREVVAGDELAPHRLRVVVVAEVEGVQQRGAEAGNQLQAVAVVPVVAIGSRAVGAVGRNGFNRDEPPGVFDAGNRAHQQRIDPAEYGRIGRNAER